MLSKFTEIVERTLHNDLGCLLSDKAPKTHTAMSSNTCWLLSSVLLLLWYQDTASTITGVKAHAPLNSYAKSGFQAVKSL